MSLLTAVAIATIILLLPVFVLKTEYGLYALLIVRPLIDLFADYTVISYRALELNLNAVVALLVIAWFGLMVLKERVQFQAIPGLWWLGAWLVWGVTSLGYSIDQWNTVAELLRLLSLMIIFIVAHHVASQRPHALTRLVPVLAIAMTLPVLVAFIQLLTATGLSFGFLDNRVYGTFGHPNVLGFYLVAVVNLLVVWQLGRRAADKSLLYPWLIAGGSLAMLFTYTRGAYVGFALVQIWLGWLYYRKALLITLGIIVGLFFGWQLINTISLNTFNYNLNDIALVQRVTTREDEADSIDWRLQVLQTMGPKTLAAPVLGVGLGNFVTLRQQGDISLFDDPEAHNDYLRLAIELGFVGLGLYLLFWTRLLVTFWKHYRAQHKASWEKRYAWFGIGLCLALLGMSLGDNLLQGTAVMWTYLAILATILAETRPISPPSPLL